MLLPLHTEINHDLTDFTSAAPKQSVPEVTPVNISLLLEIFRFAAKCPYKFDQNLEDTIKTALEIILPSNWSTSQDCPFIVTGFQQNDKTRQMLVQDICKSVCECFSNQKLNSKTALLFRHHLNQKTGFLTVKFSEFTDDLANYLDYAPLLQFLAIKRTIIQKYVHTDAKNWPTAVKVLRYIIHKEYLANADIEELQSICSKDIFVKNTKFGNNSSQFDSLALLLKIAFILKNQQQDLNVCKILLFFMDVMIDRPNPLISLEKLALVVSIILDTLKEELATLSYEREILNVIGELLDVVSVFCYNSGISDMNKQSLLPQLTQVHLMHRSPSFDLNTDQQPPLAYLYKFTSNSTIFEDMLCGLIQIELHHNSQHRKMSYESTASYKFTQKIIQLTIDQPKASSIAFLIRMMKILDMRAPPGLMARYIVCLKNDESVDQASVNQVLEYIVKSSIDLESLFDEYYKTFRRKKLMMLFPQQTVQIFKQIEGMSLKIMFLDKVVSVMLYLNQQSQVISQSDVNVILKCIVEMFQPSDQSEKLNQTCLASFKSSILKIWFLVAQSHLYRDESFEPLLIQLATITPAFVYDTEFQVWVRSNAKLAELEVFAEYIFEKLDQDLSQNGFKVGDLALKNKLDQVNRTDGTESEISRAIIEEDNQAIEVGLKLNFSERIFLAWLCQVQRLKILSKPSQTQKTLGASFVEQIVTSFSNENNFNVIVTSSTNESITTQKMQEINTPFGKQLDFLAKALINDHLSQQSNCNWSNDFSFLILHSCQDSWTTRLICNYMIQIYQFKQPCITLEIIETFSRLINSIQQQLNVNYSSLSKVIQINNRTITMPVDYKIITKVQDDLMKTITMQYISSCILGNRSQVDFTINQFIQQTSLSMSQSNNFGERCLQSLLQIQVQINTINIFEMRKAWTFDQKQFERQIQAIYAKLKLQAQVAFVFAPTAPKQTKLPLLKAYQDIEISRLQVDLQQPQPKACVINDFQFQSLIQEAAELVMSIQAMKKIDTLVTQGVKRTVLFDIVSKATNLIQNKLGQNESIQHRVNNIINNFTAIKIQYIKEFESVVQKLTPLAVDSIQISQVIQVIADNAQMLQVYLMHIHSNLPHLMHVAISSLELGLVTSKIKQAKQWTKQVGKLQNLVKKSRFQQVNIPMNLVNRSKAILIFDQHQIQYSIHIDIVLYLRNLGYNIDAFLSKYLLESSDLYSQLLFTKLSLEQGGSIQVVKDLIMKVIGKQFSSCSITEVQMWVQLINDIKFLMNDDQTVLQYLLSHLKWVLISWNFQWQITQAVVDFYPPVLQAKQAHKFISQWPDLAVKITQVGAINQKFIDSFLDTLMKHIWNNPVKYLRKSSTLKFYLKNPQRNNFLCNIWAADDLIHLLKSLSMKNMRKLSDLLLCQLTMKAFDVAPAKTIIFYLPQLFQSLRIDKNIGNLIGDFLIRKSLQYVSVAHNVLWFCKVESVLPDEREQHARKVPLPVPKENLNTITTDLYKIILQKLGGAEKIFFETETNFFEKITSISGLLQPSQSKDQKKAIIKDKLIEYNKEIPDCVYLPTNQNCRVVGIVTTSGTPMQSAARVPILISFEVEDYPGPDQDEILEHKNYIQSLFNSTQVVFKKEQQDLIDYTLAKFASQWIPILSDEDIEDDEFETNFNLNQFDEKGNNEYQGVKTHNGSMFQLMASRLLIVKRSMFAVGKKDSDSKEKVHSNLNFEDEEQQQYIKEIKTQTFSTNASNTGNSKRKAVFSVSQPNNFLGSMMNSLTGPNQKFGTRATKIWQDNKEGELHNQNQVNRLQKQGASVKVISCIFKVNDDLRQDILALQVIKHFQKIFKACELDLYVAPYRCISNRTGNDKLLGGIIEVVQNSHSRDQLGKAFEINLHEYFLKRYGCESTSEFKIARYNFIKSLAAYAVVSFILQIKDRHNGNILIDDYGHLIHIDFGFIFDWSPGKDMKFESAAFKLTKEFIDILGGSPNAPAFRLFESKVIQGFLAVRQHSEDFLNLTELMFYSGFPCFKSFSLQNLEQRFRRDLSQAEAARWMREQVLSAANKWTTRVYDYVQYKQNKIVF